MGRNVCVELGPVRLFDLNFSRKDQGKTGPNFPNLGNHLTCTIAARFPVSSNPPDFIIAQTREHLLPARRNQMRQSVIHLHWPAMQP
jgi:hypothetical protein